MNDRDLLTWNMVLLRGITIFCSLILFHLAFYLFLGSDYKRLLLYFPGSLITIPRCLELTCNSDWLMFRMEILNFNAIIIDVRSLIWI